MRRITFSAGNQPPVAVIQATPTSGAAPLSVTFDGSASNDADPGDQLTYKWDLNADGQFGDSTLKCCPAFTYPVGTHKVQLRVTDKSGASSTAAVVISSNNSAPTVNIQSPSATLKWKVGDTITFAGSASDQQDGNLGASRLSWALLLHHCPSNCHQHAIQTFEAVSAGAFTAPDHEYPSHLELRLTATDSGGLRTTTGVLLHPQTVTLRFETSPMKLQLLFNGASVKASFSKTVIVGSRNSVGAPSPQSVGSTQYNFMSWSDGGPQTHDISAGASGTVYTALYTKVWKR